ncbi:hypothetical protein A1D23_05510 [Chelonobacter oris]|uniref:restriction endonuclease subunit S n=1 Tax=Chelonobacter oris TaxID=505317 RepID=UPI00244920CA|nr:restriction endonuclease subunit S [Chelonobacter oris]MDH2999549.1 hypothetical protein [Chelonobacter oris]
MNTTNSNVPRLRFPGFTDAWEQRKLGEVSEIKTGPFGSTLHAEDYVENGEPIITTEHFKSGSLPRDKTNIPQVSNKDYIKLKSYVLKVGDIVFSRVGSVDINALVSLENKGWLFSGRVLRVRPAPIIKSEFLHYELGTTRVRNNVISRAVGQTMPSINTEILQDTFICSPRTLEEQTAIGNFFRRLDEAIATHQRKLERVKELKKSLLQKMFPRDGKAFPELRFPNFTDAWEQRKLGEIGNYFYGGGTPNTKNKSFWNGDIPWLQSSDLADDRVLDTFPRKYISEVGLNNSATKLIPKNSIAIVTRVGVGKVSFITYPYTTSQDFLSISELKVSELFGIYAISNLMKKESKSAQGTSIKGVTKNEVLDKLISIPSLKEQTAIGNFFRRLDEAIATHQRKLEHMQTLKKGLLQQMFV